MEKMKIKDCKLRDVLECDKGKNIVGVAKELRDKKHRHIIVTEKGKPEGIISTTDINNKVVAENKDLEKTKAKDIMTSPIISKDINEPLSQTYIEMIRENLFSCPVTKSGKLIGTLDMKEATQKLVHSSKK